MPRQMTEQERQEFLAEPHVGVLSVASDDDRPPSAEQMLAIARRYLPEEAARGFVKAELEHPESELILFTIRPDRWLTADFTDEVG
jgi:hypothetical protein